MPKIYNIRWTKSDSEDLAKAVKNFNAKIKRLETKYPKTKNSLPQKVSLKEMKDLIKTRADFKREINALQRFSKKGQEKLVKAPGNEYDLKITKWQKDEMTRRRAIVNRKRQARFDELGDLEVKSRGIGLGYTQKEKQKFIGMGKSVEAQLEPINAFTPRMSRTDINEKFKTLRRESQTSYWIQSDLRLKENFIRTLEEQYSQDDIKDLVEYLKEMDLNEFKVKYYESNDRFEVAYHGDRQEEEKNLNVLISTFMTSKTSKNKN